MSAYSVRCACGACVVHHSVSLPSTRSYAAIAPHVSIGAGCERGKTMSCATTTSARANAASVAARSPASQSKTWLPSSRTGVAPSANASRALITTGSGSYSTSISSSASRAE